MKKLIPFIFLLAFAISCSKETAFNNITVNDKYTIDIPDYLTPCTDIHEYASLQYKNEEKDIYAMVLDERKKTMVNYNLDYDTNEDYKNIASQPFKDNIQNSKIEIPGRQEIDGKKALVTEILGNVNDKNAFYRMAIIESPYAFYQILVWTKAEYKEKYMADITRVIESFKELPQPASELPEEKINPDSVSIQTKY